MTIEGNIIKADEGTVLTNGENFATLVRLGDWDSPDNWHEVPKEEYEAKMAEQEAVEMMGMI